MTRFFYKVGDRVRFRHSMNAMPVSISKIVPVLHRTRQGAFVSMQHWLTNGVVSWVETAEGMAENYEPATHVEMVLS